WHPSAHPNISSLSCELGTGKRHNGGRRAPGRSKQAVYQWLFFDNASSSFFFAHLPKTISSRAHSANTADPTGPTNTAIITAKVSPAPHCQNDTSLPSTPTRRV